MYPDFDPTLHWFNLVVLLCFQLWASWLWINICLYNINFYQYLWSTTYHKNATAPCYGQRILTKSEGQLLYGDVKSGHWKNKQKLRRRLKLQRKCWSWFEQRSSPWLKRDPLLPKEEAVRGLLRLKQFSAMQLKKSIWPVLLLSMITADGHTVKTSVPKSAFCVPTISIIVLRRLIAPCH